MRPSAPRSAWARGRLHSALLRILSGVVVGLIAAAMLPSVRGVLGL